MSTYYKCDSEYYHLNSFLFNTKSGIVYRSFGNKNLSYTKNLQFRRTPTPILGISKCPDDFIKDDEIINKKIIFWEMALYEEFLL